jgi:hypothetical protein
LGYGFNHEATTFPSENRLATGQLQVAWNPQGLVATVLEQAWAAPFGS